MSVTLSTLPPLIRSWVCLAWSEVKLGSSLSSIYSWDIGKEARVRIFTEGYIFISTRGDWVIISGQANLETQQKTNSSRLLHFSSSWKGTEMYQLSAFFSLMMDRIQLLHNKLLLIFPLKFAVTVPSFGTNGVANLLTNVSCRKEWN